MSKAKRELPRPCFVVVSWEGCFIPDICQAPHYLIDCTVHGLLARTHREDSARFILRGHKSDPTWPIPVEPPTEASYMRIKAADTNKSQIFVPSTYKG